MGKITVEVKINTFGTMLYSLNHPIRTLANLPWFLLLLVIAKKPRGQESQTDIFILRENCPVFFYLS